MPVYANIGGVQKQLSALYANVGGAQKQLSSMLGNVGGTGKELLEQQVDFWVVPYYTSSTMTTNTKTRMVADSVALASNGMFTLVNAASISGRPAAGKYFVSISTSADSTSTTGTTIYYAINSSGSYCAFKVTDWEATTSDPSVTSSSYGNVDAAYSNYTLLINKSKISSFYRWTQYNKNPVYTDQLTSTSGSLTFTDPYVYLSSTLQGSGTNYTFTTTAHIPNATTNQYAGYYTNNLSSDTGNIAYHISYHQNGNYVYMYDGYYTRVISSYSQGTATGKYKFAISSSAYPTNGESGSYWYANRTTVT